MPPSSSADPSWILQRAVDSSSAAQTVEDITAFAARTFSTPHAGVTLIRRHGRRFEAAGPTTDEVLEADELQNDLKEGPCVDASTESRTLVSNDLSRDPRWPTWGPRAAGLGLGSVLSSEIHAGGRRVGALNVYGTLEREFSREDFELAHLLATHAAIALSFAQKVEGLTIALDSRTTIGQAQGILMHQYHLDSDRAFAILKRLSQDENVRLLHVAQRVIDETNARDQ